MTEKAAAGCGWRRVRLTAVFYELVERVKDAVIVRVYEITGTSEADLWGNP